MIKFHPNKKMLTAFSAGELPLSLSIAVSAHIELCEECAQQAQQVEESLSHDTWHDESLENADFGDMLQSIMTTSFEPLETVVRAPHARVHIAGRDYQLPTAFRQYQDLKWSGFGAISRARIVNDEKNVRASLLHIGEGGRIPEHKHKGYELTLLLDGSFTDESGTYEKGDFILLDGDKSHSPYTEKGCLCYAVQDAPLHFMSGVSKVLNPLGNLIY
ncbi:ChrR family anti-sigma-E factor [Psychromonas sp. Urea-02u-13]|uniref:ChrR family anti-sigma-E factor n=1 Tax=Psychromonas sp. Urea-02u-13 TaxID=2058326 RepID=UPI000C3403FB|nr:ChrR family anti-sigma-E factor [Psychromonas sp. Urea-02u-13]PKG38473.1 transcriptional regulator [Psychromonas sp. Urea-02u-13]